MVLQSNVSVFLFHVTFSCVKEESRICQLNSLQFSLSALAPVNVVPIQKSNVRTLTQPYEEQTHTSHLQQSFYKSRSFFGKDDYRQATTSCQHSE